MRMRPTLKLPPARTSAQREAVRDAQRIWSRVRLPIVSQASLQSALDAFVSINRRLLRAYPSTGLVAGGIRYRREYPREEWLTAPVLEARGEGDCEDLASYLAARTPGARAFARRSRGGRGYHALTRLASGRIVDPSAALGM